MDIVLATANPHKREEFSRLLPEQHLLMPSDLDVRFDFEETAETFTDNAMGKAMALYGLLPSPLPVLADDSGLCVDALDGKPGIRTARYGMEIYGRMLEAEERNALLLKNLERIWGKGERRATFVCALALVVAPHRIFTISETVDGSIAEEPDGKGGFGYDPVFVLRENGRTMASLSEREKDQLSHRGRATAHLRTLLEELT